MESYGSVLEKVGNVIGPTEFAYVALTVQMLLETTLMMIWRPIPFYVIYVIRKSQIQTGITPKQGIGDIVLSAVKIIEVRIYFQLPTTSVFQSFLSM